MGAKVEKVSEYVRNGKKVESYARKGEGAQHRADFKELAKLRAEKEAAEAEHGEAAQIRGILRKMQTAQSSITNEEWSQYISHVAKNAVPSDAADAGADAGADASE